MHNFTRPILIALIAGVIAAIAVSTRRR
jgi:hypothetical protein